MRELMPPLDTPGMKACMIASRHGKADETLTQAKEIIQEWKAHN